MVLLMVSILLLSTMPNWNFGCHTAKFPLSAKLNMQYGVHTIWLAVANCLCARCSIWLRFNSNWMRQQRFGWDENVDAIFQDAIQWRWFASVFSLSLWIKKEKGSRCIATSMPCTHNYYSIKRILFDYDPTLFRFRVSTISSFHTTNNFRFTTFLLRYFFSIQHGDILSSLKTREKKNNKKGLCVWRLTVQTLATIRYGWINYTSLCIRTEESFWEFRNASSSRKKSGKFLSTHARMERFLSLYSLVYRMQHFTE